MNPETQESVTEEQSTPEVEAEETSSPEVTDEGASSSDAAAEEPEQSPAETAVAEFLEKHGSEEEPEQVDDQPPVEADEPAPKAEQVQESVADKDDGEDEEFRLSDSEFKGLSDGAKKRIGHLNARVKKTERQLAETQSSLDAARDAEARLDRVRQFAEQNKLTSQDVTMGLGTMAKFATGDFDGFLKAVTPMYEKAMQATGKAFSPDLKDRVDNGYLTEDDAREITRSRLNAEMAKQESDRLSAQHARAQSQQKHQAHVHDIVNAVNAREAELRQSDPDFAQKEPVMKRVLEFALSNGATPANREQAIKMVNDAYEEAAASMPKPAPKATPPRPSASTVSRGRTQPATLLDALSASPPPQG